MMMLLLLLLLLLFVAVAVAAVAGVDFVKPSAIYANTSDVSSVPPPTRTSASSSPQKQSIVKLDSLYSDINGSLEIKTLEEKTAVRKKKNKYTILKHIL